MDLSAFEDEILKGLAGLLGLGVMWLLRLAIAWVGLRLSAERQAALARAIDKMLMLGVTRAEDVIAKKGWDHIDSKDAVIKVALQALPDKFPETLKAAKLDLAKDDHRDRVLDQMQRMIPEVFARAAASPATPPHQSVIAAPAPA